MEENVFAQILNNMACLSFHAAFEFKIQIAYIAVGMEQTKKQLTAKEHVEIFLNFKFLFRLFAVLLDGRELLN